MLRLDFNEATHDFARRAQYWPYVLWSRFGDVLLPVTSGFDPATELSVYAGRADENVVSLLAVNKAARRWRPSSTCKGRDDGGASRHRPLPTCAPPR
ncbi:MAG: hypothetical protein R2851_08310 [Caldilineaceae bacterium]